MTCIVGIEREGRVWVGGDRFVGSPTIGNTLTVPKINRITIKGDNCPGCDILVGHSGSLRMLNAIEAETNWPGYDGRNPLEWLIKGFIETLREKISGWGVVTTNDDGETNQSSLLVAMDKRLYIVHDDFSIHRVTEASIGSGYQYAFGAMKAAEGLSAKPEEIVEIALEAAAHWCPTVNGPFDIMEL